MGHTFVWWSIIALAVLMFVVFLLGLYMELRDLHKLDSLEPEDNSATWLISSNFHRGPRYAPGGGNSHQRRFFRRHGRRQN